MNSRSMNKNNQSSSLQDGNKGNEMAEDRLRERKIYRVTVLGSIINVLLVALKFAFGILGCSSAMIADAVHSLSDLITDVVVIVFVKLSNKPQDSDHDYGHGKYETLATAFIGLALFAVGIMILYGGAEKIAAALRGEVLPQPGMIALWAALISIVSKEWCYRFTVRVGREAQSQAVVANAWHHRSDAFSSVGTALGIGGAIFLGERWTVLDPIAAVVVSIFIIKTALALMKQASDELLEKSLPEETERKIKEIAEAEDGVSGVHNLRTRRIGNRISIEMHLRMPGGLTLYEAHRRATDIEQELRQHFGDGTYINLHIEPLKVNGRYVEPKEV